MPLNPHDLEKCKIGESVRAQGQVEQELNLLINVIESLETKVDNLTSRLSNILRNESPDEVGEQKELDVLVPVADLIRNQRHRLAEIIYIIDSANDRLEL